MLLIKFITAYIRINLNKQVFCCTKTKSLYLLETRKLHKQGVFGFCTCMNASFCVSVHASSCITCCWADFGLRQQDLGQHRTRGSHRWTGRPASPHLQNVDKPRSTERSGINIATVLSYCNYAPLCMPLQPREHTHC